LDLLWGLLSSFDRLALREGAGAKKVRRKPRKRILRRD